MAVGIAPPNEPVLPYAPHPIIPDVEPSALPLTHEAEAAQRARVVEEANSWIGTPYVQQGDVKGPKGCVDCSMILVRCWVDAGVFKPFDPRPYSPSWHLHRSEEKYLEWMQTLAVEVEEPQPGDIVVWRFGRCYSHGGIMVGPNVAVQASMFHGITFPVDIDEAWLRYLKGGVALRPRKFFDIWARLREKYGTGTELVS